MGRARELSIEDDTSGPVRARIHRGKSRNLPYSRISHTNLQSDVEDPSIMGKVKSIISWLLPGWVSSNQPEQTENFPPEPASETDFLAESMDMKLDSEREQIEIENSTKIFKRLAEGPESRVRRMTYQELARFFKSKGRVKLSGEEYEQIALIIQKQSLTSRTRTPVMETPLKQSLTPKVDPLDTIPPATVVETPMVEKAIEAHSKSLEPVQTIKKPVVAKSRVFSARFDDYDGEESFFLKKSIESKMKSGHLLSENRQKLIEEARKRVAEQIRNTKNEGQPVEPKKAGENVRIKEDVTEEKPRIEFDNQARVGEAEKQEKKAPFSFTITTFADANKPEESQATKIVDFPKPKLIFDFDGDAADNSKEKPLIKLDEPLKPSFPFGAKESAQEVTTTVKTESLKPSAGFTFGQPASKPFDFSAKPAGESKLTDEHKPAFNFGNQQQQQQQQPQQATSLGFSFGQPSASIPKVEQPHLSTTAILSSSDQGKPLAEKPQIPLFSFGTGPEDKSKPLLGSGTGSDDKTKPLFGTGTDGQAKPSFSFGSGSDDKAKPSFSFGTGSDDKTKPPLSFGSSGFTPIPTNNDLPTQPIQFVQSTQPTPVSAPFSFGSKQPASSFPTISFDNKTTSTAPLDTKPSFTFGFGSNAPQASTEMDVMVDERSNKKSSFQQNDTQQSTFPPPPPQPFAFGSTIPETKPASQPFSFNEQPAPLSFNFSSQSQGQQDSQSTGGSSQPFQFGSNTTGIFNVGPSANARILSIPKSRRKH